MTRRRTPQTQQTQTQTQQQQQQTQQQQQPPPRAGSLLLLRREPDQSGSATGPVATGPVATGLLATGPVHLELAAVLRAAGRCDCGLAELRLPVWDVEGRVPYTFAPPPALPAAATSTLPHARAAPLANTHSDADGAVTSAHGRGEGGQVCPRFVQMGKCTKSHCLLAHVPPPFPFCHAYARAGGCNHGSGCHFEHLSMFQLAALDSGKGADSTRGGGESTAPGGKRGRGRAQGGREDAFDAAIARGAGADVEPTDDDDGGGDGGAGAGMQAGAKRARAPGAGTRANSAAASPASGPVAVASPEPVGSAAKRAKPRGAQRAQHGQAKAEELRPVAKEKRKHGKAHCLDHFELDNPAEPARAPALLEEPRVYD
ncbi:hypothetical protein T492DRAFT_913308 [Pavlovales sp. CCMP2436]|nr:hypothetical protein T492DRAFT_913308 [Pavlovales sp. CCMP2436]